LARATAAQEPATPLPEDTCAVALEVPDGTTSAVDGRDYGTRRQLSFRPLRPGQTYRSQLVVRFPDGATATRTLLLEGGRRIRLALRPADDRRPELVAQTGHAGVVCGVAFSPDGARVATGSYDLSVVLWDTASGRQLRAFPVADATPLAVAFSPDGRQLLAATNGGEVVAWDAASGVRLRTTKLQIDDVLFDCACFSADARQVLLGLSRVSNAGSTNIDRTAALCDARNGQALRRYGRFADSPEALVFGPDGPALLTNYPGSRAALWDLASTNETFATHDEQDWAVAYAPQTHLWAVGSGNGALALRESTDAAAWRTLIKPHESGANIESLAFDATGRWLLVGLAGGTAELWDAESGARVRTFQGRTEQLRTVRFGLSGANIQMAFGAADPMNRAFNAQEWPLAWDGQSGGQAPQYPPDTQAYLAVLSPDEKYAAVSSFRDDPFVFDVATGTVACTLSGEGPIDLFVFSPDGRQLLGDDIGQHAAIVWEIPSGRQAAVLPYGTDKTGPNNAVFSADGRSVAAYGVEFGLVEVWDLDSATVRAQLKVNDGFPMCTSLAFGPSGGQLLVGYLDRGPVLWDIAGERQIRRFAGDDFFTGRDDGSGGVLGVAIRPDGRQVLGGGQRGIVALWDTATGSLLRTFRDHPVSVTAVAFSPDGERILSGAVDGSVRISEIATGETLATLLGLSGGQDWLAVTPDGLFDGSVQGRQQVAFRVGDGLNVVPVDRFFQDFYRPGLLGEVLGGVQPTAEVDVGRSLPPTVRIVSPVSGDALDREIEIEAQATDAGGGVAPLRIYQNGARLLADGETRQEGPTVFRTFRVTLIEGENRFRVVSATADESWESEPAEVVLRYAQPLERPNLHVLAVGVSRYADAGLNLKYAAADAQALTGLFDARGRALYDNVHVTQVLDEQATRTGIVEALAAAAEQTRPQDTLLLFLSGHGAMVGQRYYFVPHDLRRQADALEEDLRAQGLPADELCESLVSAQALKRVLIFDTCASGGALPTATGGRGFALRGAVERLARSQGVFTIAASAASQEAQESDELGHGVLSYALLAGLDAVDRGPLDDRHVEPNSPDRVVDVLEWFTFAAGQVPRLSERLHGAAQDVQTGTQGSSFPMLPLDD
jgi:WD40 repeat protein